MALVQHVARGLPHLIHGDGIQNGGPVLHVLDRQPGRQRLTIAFGQTHHAVLGIDVVGADLGLDPRELLRLDTILRHIVQNLVHGLFGLGHPDTGRGHDDKAEGRVVIGQAVIARGGVKRDLAVELKPFRHDRGLRAAAQRRGKDRQRRRRLLVARIAFGGQIAARQIGLRDARVAIAQPPFGPLRGFLRPHARADPRRRRQRAIVFLGQRPDLIRRHVARDDQHRVIGGVIGLVPVQRILPGQLLHLRPPADDRRAIGMVQELRRLFLFAEDGAGVAVGALVAFLDDDLTLGLPVVLGQVEVAHPVRLHLHHQLQPVHGDALVIGGEIP